MFGLSIDPCQDPTLLAWLHADTVVVAYAPYFPNGSPPPTVAQLEVIWANRLVDPTASAFVAAREGRPVGSVMVRQDPDFAAEGQLVGLHVLPETWGVGVGSALHDVAINTLASRGFSDAGLWVIDANQRASRMYEARRWIVCPGLILDYLGLTEVRYRRSLAPVEQAPGDVAG